MKRPLQRVARFDTSIFQRLCQTKSDCSCSPEQFSKAFHQCCQNRLLLPLSSLKCKARLKSAICSAAKAARRRTPLISSATTSLTDFLAPANAGSGKPTPQLSQGIRFLVTADGYVLTNAHVIKGAEKITVVFHDGQNSTPRHRHRPAYRLAVVKSKGKTSLSFTLGDSEHGPGEWVIAIGSPFQLEATVTVGVISAKEDKTCASTTSKTSSRPMRRSIPETPAALSLTSTASIGINTAIVSAAAATWASALRSPATWPATS